VSWRDLLRALDEEAAREVEELRTSAAEYAERAVAEARRDVESERQAALGRARAAAEGQRRRALSEAQRERARAVLAEQRRILDDVRAQALEALRRGDGRGLRELVAAAAADVGDSPSTWIADAASLAALREVLEREHPSVLCRAHLSAAPEARGGFEVVLERRVLDLTAAARLERIWPEAEAGIAQALFGAPG
jgi:V/A-type H+-transporting ATPase subunit E